MLIHHLDGLQGRLGMVKAWRNGDALQTDQTGQACLPHLYAGVKLQAQRKGESWQSDR
jgi:hypothetical protein